MLPTFDLRTYQDVKKNLSWVGGGVLLVLVAAVYVAVLPPSHRSAVDTAFGTLPDWLTVVGVPAVVGAIAAILFGRLMIHDDVYDARIVKWRKRYDLEYLLPRLLAPIADDVNPAFWERARGERSEVMYRLFYPFVRDREGLISENARVRFYERVELYWMTQQLEMGALALLLVTFVYGVIYVASDLNPLTLVWVAASALLVFAVNRRLRALADAGVRAATAEEIAEIHSEHLPSLRERVRELHAYLGLSYPHCAAAT